MTEEWVIKQNISRYRRLLEAETDHDKQLTLRNLLAESRERLAGGDRKSDSSIAAKGRGSTETSLSSKPPSNQHTE
ncbi:hypothetical protein GG804_18450 [Sphingomonas histidinilytica]|uniref:hypothetical protein n=1 Tax=Rhizorhabdus histidinilytica TaxID=439228 RepID=UPI001ADB550A|nr:hypothetical protein [Rhizorhabdus histidinilytica]MBO9378754.1 hypothetical protein [Rhizorhabdus histidinilytica]